MRLLDKGVYGLAEASRLADVNAVNARRWFLGRRDYAPSTRVLNSDVPDVGGKHAISFLDLIDLRVVGRFRARGIGMPTIRKVYERLAERLETKHPFAHSKLVVFGKTVMEEVASEKGETRLREVISGQEAMHKILRRYLEDVEYNEEHDNLAILWHIYQGVVVDPTRNLGKPITKSGAGTFVLASAYAANHGRAELVADLFNTSTEVVLDAVGFEDWLSGKGRSAA